MTEQISKRWRSNQASKTKRAH
ncbi:hypothetical protein HID58_003059 [Brassica napus]|uniref:Uncharacterized protein n=1 Tax=Brassica napus TaxID=3708 RepID=A0ABQ8EP16_BRANA|nr:hypothetical protein HID58_003059 [Brassica napus]